MPLIIIYALGYTFDFDKKILSSTGGIYLKSYPNDADIFLDDKAKRKTNRFITHLKPKTYEVRVEKENYHSWKKQLTVEQKIVTKADNILLIPFNPKILLTATNSKEYEDFFTEPYPKEILNLIKRKSKYTIFNISNISLNNKGDKIYFLSNNNLYSLDLDKNNLEDSELSDKLISNVLKYIMYKNGILYLDYFTGKIFELDLSSLKTAEVFDQVFPNLNQCDWTLSTNNKKLLCKKYSSVEILWLERVANNSIIRKKGDIEKIYFNQKINDIIWHPKTDEHLIISTNDSILITELDNREPRNTINFISTPLPEIQYNSKTETLYFFSQNRLYETGL